MSETELYSLAEAHETFAKQFNKRVWTLLEVENRTEEEEHELVQAAHASYYHWQHIGTAVHRQRGEWLLAHVYSVLEDEPAALHYAHLCLATTEAYPDEMADYDLAYAHEALARAHALNGYRTEASKYLNRAQELGLAIADPEDQRIFLADFNAGEWYGLM